MTTSLARVVTEGEAAARELPMPAYFYGVIAMALFLLGLAVLWSFRGTAQRVPSNTHDSGHHGHH